MKLLNNIKFLLLSSNGRINRSEFFVGTLLAVILESLLILLVPAIIPIGLAFDIFVIIATIIFVLLMFNLIIKRVNDIGEGLQYALFITSILFTYEILDTLSRLIDTDGIVLKIFLAIVSFIYSILMFIALIRICFKPSVKSTKEQNITGTQKAVIYLIISYIISSSWFDFDKYTLKTDAITENTVQKIETNQSSKVDKVNEIEEIKGTALNNEDCINYWQNAPKPGDFEKLSPKNQNIELDAFITYNCKITDVEIQNEIKSSILELVKANDFKTIKNF